MTSRPPYRTRYLQTQLYEAFVQRLSSGEQPKLALFWLSGLISGFGRRSIALRQFRQRNSLAGECVGAVAQKRDLATVQEIVADLDETCLFLVVRQPWPHADIHAWRKRRRFEIAVERPSNAIALRTIHSERLERLACRAPMSVATGGMAASGACATQETCEVIRLSPAPVRPTRSPAPRRG